jgi:UDP-glucose 4-epimerase
MKIIVTGGAGFIASHIVDAYFKAGHEVVVIDNLTSGFKRNVNPRAKFYVADIKNLKLMGKIFKRERPQVVNHHAAIAEVIKSIRNPIPTFETNILGTTNILLSLGEYGRGKKIKFIFSSTGGAIYGEPDKIPANEKTPPDPLSPYGLSKLLDEEIIKFYSRKYGFEYLILRYPNVYGPRQNPKGEAGVIAIFGGLMKGGKRPTIFGDGTKTRDYVYVEDTVRANITGLRKGENEILNLGWGKEISDQLIFDTIAKELNFPKKPIYAPCRKGEVRRIALDASRARRVLDWRPKINLKEGIRKTIKAI